MQLQGIIFLALAFTSSTADRQNDANNYLEKVLVEHLPSAIEAAGIKVYKMPDFFINHQEKTSDDHVLNTKIFYGAGNLTGLQEVSRDFCKEPTESSGNVSVVCQVGLPHLKAEYSGRFQSIKGLQNPFGVHVRQYDFHLNIDIRNLKIGVEVTSSPSIQIPVLKQLAIESGGERSIKFHTEASDPEDVTKGVEERFNKPFFQLFIGGGFQKALEVAVRKVRFPKSE